MANTPTNVLKTQGDQSAQDWGHDKPYRTACLRSRNLLAWLCHTVWQGSIVITEEQCKHPYILK
jgi:hypothetical protein